MHFSYAKSTGWGNHRLAARVGNAPRMTWVLHPHDGKPTFAHPVPSGTAFALERTRARQTANAANTGADAAPGAAVGVLCTHPPQHFAAGPPARPSLPTYGHVERFS